MVHVPRSPEHSPLSMASFIPLSRYGEIGLDFLHSFSFPLFVLYLLMISQARRWKRATEPRKLTKVLIVYNIAICLVNVYCFLGFLYCLWHAPSLFDKRPDPLLKHVLFVYWLTKVIELLDTVFMMLRHNFRQISSLHVYHHASMLLLSDLGYSKYAWAAFSMPLMLNALVHIFLYLYYGLTAGGFRPAWKRRLTELQIVQFVIDLVHAVVGFLRHDFCSWCILYGGSMLYLFSSFYVKNYLGSNDAQSNKFRKTK